MCDALAFDLDGTLWDATAACVKGWNDGLASLQIKKSITVADLKSVTGRPIKECIKTLLPLESEQYPRLLDVIRSCEETALLSRGGAIYDGLSETLERLARRYDLFLVSNCQKWYLELFWGFSNSKKYFRAADCHGLSGLSKPEMLAKLKKQYRLVTPVYVGDTVWDELAARDAGYAFVYAAYGFGSAKQPDFTIGSLPELERFFKSENYWE
jgi:phosphoglycolate phosphatase